tara:strand:- start:2092 stop:2526 length:435 start_codon:yes stop_codon:yes gene_type:complete
MKRPIIILMTIVLSLAADDKKVTDLFGKSKAHGSQFPGEYVGIYIDDGNKIKYGLQIFALGGGKFRAVGYNGGLPGAGFEKGGKIEVVEGKLGKSRNGERIIFQNDDEEAIADLRNGKLTAHEAGALIAKLKKIERKNPVVEKH